MIKADALTRTYGDTAAVAGVSFQIGPKEIVGLLGHNGAGKTTIMKMITGYLEPSSGRVTVNGLDVVDQRLGVQKEIGYLPENCPLYPEMNVVDHLEYAAALKAVPQALRSQRIAYAIGKTRLSDVAGKTVSTLSRGYRQRLGVAQAILNMPKLLILDEPTNGLDPSQILEMRSLIKELAANATIVVSTHILQEVQAVCSRVIVINRGRLALDQSLDKLQSQGRLLVSTDKEPDTFLTIAANIPQLSLLHHEEKNGKHDYILDSGGADGGSISARLSRLLIEKGANLYVMQPLVRDLETIFGEISAGDKAGEKPDVDTLLPAEAAGSRGAGGSRETAVSG